MCIKIYENMLYRIKIPRIHRALSYSINYMTAFILFFIAK